MASEETGKRGGAVLRGSIRRSLRTFPVGLYTRTSPVRHKSDPVPGVGGFKPTVILASDCDLEEGTVSADPATDPLPLLAGVSTHRLTSELHKGEPTAVADEAVAVPAC
jgi:hypothetical protein